MGLLIFPPHTPKDKRPDALCLMVNGLEGLEDVAAVKDKVQQGQASEDLKVLDISQVLIRSTKPAPAPLPVSGGARTPDAETDRD